MPNTHRAEVVDMRGERTLAMLLACWFSAITFSLFCFIQIHGVPVGYGQISEGSEQYPETAVYVCFTLDSKLYWTADGSRLTESDTSGGSFWYMPWMNSRMWLLHRDWQRLIHRGKLI
jgi:hypothetical protein